MLKLHIEEVKEGFLQSVVFYSTVGSPLKQTLQFGLASGAQDVSETLGCSPISLLAAVITSSEICLPRLGSMLLWISPILDEPNGLKLGKDFESLLV